MMLNSETVFHDNPYAGPSTSLLSDDEEDVTTSPSLTFGKYFFFRINLSDFLLSNIEVQTQIFFSALDTFGSQKSDIFDCFISNCFEFLELL